MNVSPPPSEDPKLFIIAKRCGRLGNQLLLFANLIAYAAEHGDRVTNMTFHGYAHLFETTQRDIYGRYPVSKRRSLFDASPWLAAKIRKSMIFYRLIKGVSKLNEKFRLRGRRSVTLREEDSNLTVLMEGSGVQNKIAGTKWVFLHSWGFRAPEAVEKHADKIRSYFRPVEAIDKKTRAIIQRMRAGVDVVVGVHIRHGDYRDFLGGRYFFTVPRYAEWMREVAAQFPGKKVAFFVSSEEPRQREEFPDLTVEFAAGTPVEDMYTLAWCDYVMGPVSTFSQWASFYGGAPMLQFSSSEDRAELAKFQVAALN